MDFPSVAVCVGARWPSAHHGGSVPLSQSLENPPFAAEISRVEMNCPSPSRTFVCIFQVVFFFKYPNVTFPKHQLLVITRQYLHCFLFNILI